MLSSIAMHPRRQPPVLLVVLISALASCGQKKPVTLKPEGYASQNVLTVEQGDLKAVFVDNTAIRPDHRSGYNGIAQLYHAQADSGIFVPAYAGFNLEHIFGGDSLHQLFEPRLHPMTLYRKTDTEVLLYQSPTPLSNVESLTSFKVVPPHYVDIRFQCVFHDVGFFRHGYAGLFWASYIRKPEDGRIHFRGVSGKYAGATPGWIAAWSEVHGERSTHQRTNDEHDFYFADNFNAPLANHFSPLRYMEPWYFGRYGDMVLAFLADGRGVIRFSQSPTGGGEGNPAWDLQYIIPSPEAEQKYSFNVRMVYKPFISDDDIAREYERWRAK